MDVEDVVAVSAFSSNRAMRFAARRPTGEAVWRTGTLGEPNVSVGSVLARMCVERLGESVVGSNVLLLALYGRLASLNTDMRRTALLPKSEELMNDVGLPLPRRSNSRWPEKE